MDLNAIASLSSALVALFLALFALIIGKKGSTNLILSLLALAISGWCFGQFMGGVVAEKSAVLFWTRFNLGCAVFIPVFYYHFIHSYIQKKFSVGWLYLIGLSLLALDFTPLFVADVAAYAGYKYYPIAGPAYYLFGLLAVGLLSIGLLRLIQYIRVARPGQANQAEYVLLASAIGIIGGLTALFPVFNINLPVISHYLMPVFLALIIYVIVKHRLVEIEYVLTQSLVYSILTVFFTAFYALVILLSTQGLQSVTKYNYQLTVILVVFASVVVFQPLRELVQSWVDRLFFRGNYRLKNEIRELANENSKLYHGLLQADKLAALGTLAAGMAHEIKNPLAAIKGLTQILPENCADPQFMQKYHEIVPRQLDRINKIVNDLLDYGQPNKLALSKVNLGDLLKDVLSLVENQCHKSGIEIINELEPLPPLVADQAKLHQLFLNLVLNAIQAMPQGGALTLSCANSSEKEICLILADTGQGIPAEKLQKIFDPFYTTKETGVGLGLAVVQRIIKEHGGFIEVASQPGKGTKFKICLPIKPGPSA